MKLETIAIHSGNTADAHTGAVIQPITLSTTFERAEDGSYPGGYVYSRAANPNRRSLEAVLTQLEGGEDACAFSSGNAAGGALFQSLPPGSHIVAPEDMYHGLKKLLNTVYKDVLDVTYCDLTNVDNFIAAIRPSTRLVWIETPSNPMLHVSDIAALSTEAKKHAILVAVDNTFATPFFQRPFISGADLVMHSTTKYLGGHSDVLGGALVTRKRDEQWEKIRNVQEVSGGVPSPFDCYMTVRGIKTFPYRMRGHYENAGKIARFLEGHNRVEKVFYPGLSSHPHYEVAAKQMCGFGGMVSFLVEGGSKEAIQVISKLRLFTIATSLGGVESLAEHRASVEGPGTRTPQNLIRLSVGLEHADDLLDDLARALED